jgi:NADPH:quinone reductase-like Zn-dependent oxidoreductase/acyl carrier protein
MSSIEPIPGQFAYSAANAFLDSFARFRAARYPGLTVSIDWGFWQELGMIEAANIPDAVKRSARDEIEAKGWSNRGVEIFTRILQSQAPAQLLVTPRPPSAMAANTGGAGEMLDHSVLRSLTMENSGCAVFSGTISESSTWLVSEHRVGGQAVLPATAYLDLAVTAFWHRHGRCPVELTDVCFLTPMALIAREIRQVRLILEEDSGGCVFRVASQLSQETWQEHARGEIQTCTPEAVHERIDIEKIEQRLAAESDGSSHIPAGFWARAKGFEPHWRNVAVAAFGSSEGVARFELAPELTADLSQFALHPALLDTATGFMAWRPEFDPFVPFSFRRVCVFDRLPASCASAFRFVPGSPVFAGSVVDALGNEIVRVEEYTLRRAVGAAATRSVQVPAENVTLEIGSPGELQTLGYRPCPRSQPRAGEVEIEVRAAGLNFIEVLYAFGMLPQVARRRAAFGQECAGVVARAGDGVEGLKPGDEVIAYGSACFSLYTTLRAETVARKPAGLSFEAAAGLPAAFATSWYSLMHLARLQPGDRILIHAAAGGVGLAAVRIAQWRGAEIFATAGSPEKRRFLSELGIAHVMDSRSLAFANEVRRITNGEGIDVVLNSLGGDFIATSLELLRRHGRFLELGKRDIFRNTALGMGAFANSIAFFAVDMGPDVPGFAVMWRELIAHFQAQSFGPVPYQTFPATCVQEAFEHMAQARHIGKVVLSFEDAASVRAAAGAPPAGLRWGDVIRRDRGTVLPNSGSPAPTPTSVPRAAAFAGHERPPLPTEFRAPESATEKAIAGVWEKLLGAAPIGAEDDFFALKGDSLLAAQVMSQLQRLFEVKLPLSLIFDFPTVRGLAVQIDSSLSPRQPFDKPIGKAPAAQLGEPASVAAERILPALPDTDYPLTHAQKRLWILAQNPAASVAYNMSYSLSLDGALDLAALRQAFGLMVGRHEVLRTAFITKGGEPRQQVCSAPPFSLLVLDLRGASGGAAAMDREIAVEALTAFALDRPPLLRARLLHVAEHKHVLLVTLHHIIADGLSLNVLMHELHVFYAALCANIAPALPPLTIHYKDFAVWQQQQVASKAMQTHRSYWLEKLGGELPVLALPTDRPRPSLQQFSGGQVVLRLPPPAQAALYQRCREQGVTLFMLLVAALKVLLHQTTGQADILIGSPVAGREQGELAGQIGYYLNNVVLRDTIRRSEPFTVLLQRVRNTVTEAIAHQAYPFDLLIEELAITPEPGRSPLFDVQLNLMPSEVPALQLGNLAVAGSVTNSQTAIFDLNFMFSDGALGLAVEISYSTALFDAATIEQLGDRLLRLLTAIGGQPEVTVRMLCALLDEGASAAEKAEFLATSLNLDEEF